MTENHLKCLTYITIRSSISPPDNGVHAIDKLIVSGGRMSYNQGRMQQEVTAGRSKNCRNEWKKSKGMRKWGSGI